MPPSLTRTIAPIFIFLKISFYQFLEPANGKFRENLFHLFIFSILSVLVVFLLSIVAVNTMDKPGDFGDIFRGILGPILTFITFMGLLITIVLQQEELKDTREELRRSASALESQLNSIDRQNFESTFFQMLNLHNTIVNSIDIRYSKTQVIGGAYGEFQIERKGRDCFNIFFNNYQEKYNETDPFDTDRDRLQKAYDEFWNFRQQDLAHYYRYLYNVLRFVHEYDGKIDKNRYIRLLRAQLSDYEMALLFYTALNKNGIRYWIYINDYKLFDNLPEDLLLNQDHKKLYSSRSFGEPKEPHPEIWPPRSLSLHRDAELAHQSNL